ncbi:MAG: hypothetical protein WCW17_01390 [Patescibacteria group bacterium]
MLNNRKKIILIITIIILFFGLLIMFLLLNKNKNNNNTNSTKTTNAKQILNDTIFFPTINENSELLYIAGKEQAIIKYSLKDKTTIKNYPIDVPYINYVSWSNDKKLILMNTTDQINNLEIFYTYNLEQEKLSKLNENIFDPYWSDDKLIYEYLDVSKVSINQSDWDGTNFQKISDPENCDEFKYYNPDTQDIYCENVKEDMLVDFVRLNLKSKKKDILYENVFITEKIYPSEQKILIQYKKEDNNIFEIINTTDGSIFKINNITNNQNLDKFNLISDKLYYSLNNKVTSEDNIFIADTKTNTIEQKQFIGENLDPTTILLDSNNLIYFLSNNYLYKFN